MNDHELDDQIRRLAQSYNDPPPAPREAMWARIESARAGASIVPISASRRMYWLRLGAGIAAVLVVGIGIGRLTRDVGRPAAAVATSTVSQPRETLHTERPAATVASVAEPAIGDDQASRAASAQDERGTNPVRSTRDERLLALRNQRIGAGRDLATYAAPRASGGGEGSDMSAYRLTAVEHMARAEILLTSFLAESRGGAVDARTAAQFASLSRELLKTTRLLLATHSADDPALTRLLEDLELVLMQISQYSAEGRRGDLDAINQSLDRRNVLPKLRSTIPAGASASTGL